MNLSGSWEGEFGYPADELPVTPFIARIVDNDESLSGSIVEPHLFTSGQLEAELFGDRHGTIVRFVKSYGSGEVEGYEELVHYSGELSNEEDVIAGRWVMLDWSGWFEMRRDASVPAYELSEVTVAES